jgi:tRNA(adenine34) deaminase
MLARGGTPEVGSPEEAGSIAYDPDDVRWMWDAIAEARAAEAAGEVPIGCILVHRGRVIARTHNLRERSQDPTAHAELIAIKSAAARLATWRLTGVTAYVTLEPCPMCAGALVNARVDRVVYGATDPKAGATNTLYSIGSDARLNHRFSITNGVLAEECGALLSTFFARIRAGRRGDENAK